eukprot:Amastigsp_a177026_15.p3 type:complete len:100 gc:universal Amastigsp_a177026_15:472-173(-)
MWPLQTLSSFPGLTSTMPRSSSAQRLQRIPLACLSTRRSRLPHPVPCTTTAPESLTTPPRAPCTGSRTRAFTSARTPAARPLRLRLRLRLRWTTAGGPL